MTVIQKVSRTELARNTRQVLSDVQRGRTLMIQSHGKTEAALLDIEDYLLLRGTMRAFAEPTNADIAQGLSAEDVESVDEIEDQYALVLEHYFARSISLNRAAELLGLPWFELRGRCARLGIPLHTGVDNADDAAADVRTAEEW